MERLALSFYLAPSLVPAAGWIAAELESRLGCPVVFDPDASDDARRRQLDRDEPGVAWLCGLETLQRKAEGRLDVEVVAAPVFAGQPGPVYHSVVVVGETCAATSLGDVSGATVAVNQPTSWSGHHALRALLAAEGSAPGAVARVVVTGDHDSSIDALLAGRADVAAIDHTVWAARRAADGHTARLRILARTPDWPAPPFSVSRSLAPSVRRVIRDALVAMRPPGLDGIAPATDAEYQAMVDTVRIDDGGTWPR